MQRWLARHKCVDLHFHSHLGELAEPRLERFLSIISRQAIHGGSFSSVRDLVRAIRTYIDAWNERCEPFVVDQGGRRGLAHCKPEHPPTGRSQLPKPPTGAKPPARDQKTITRLFISNQLNLIGGFRLERPQRCADR